MVVLVPSLPCKIMCNVFVVPSPSFMTMTSCSALVVPKVEGFPELLLSAFISSIVAYASDRLTETKITLG